MKSYKIVRCYFFSEANETIETGLTLEEAQRHCSDPETSSLGYSDEAMDRTKRMGPWFDSYVSEID
jgi:hypothetical protein